MGPRLEEGGEMVKEVEEALELTGPLLLPGTALLALLPPAARLLARELGSSVKCKGWVTTLTCWLRLCCLWV